MKISAIVPMKGHSERVPGKNLRLLAGKPLFYWIINELVHCDINVYVDTDSDDIATAVKQFFGGARIIGRPDDLKGDAVSMNRILEYDLTQIEGEHFIQTHSTSPLLKAETIRRGIDAYFAELGDYDSLYSVSEIQARCFTHDGKPINHNPNELIQTQYLKPVLVENSGFYVFSRDSFTKHKRRIGERPLLFPIAQYEAVDIDNEEDFQVAEILCAARMGR